MNLEDICRAIEPDYDRLYTREEADRYDSANITKESVQKKAERVMALLTVAPDVTRSSFKVKALEWSGPDREGDYTSLSVIGRYDIYFIAKSYLLLFKSQDVASYATLELAQAAAQSHLENHICPAIITVDV